MAILLALTLTPSLLLTFPVFFTSTRRYGLSLEGCCCGVPITSRAASGLEHLSNAMLPVGVSASDGTLSSTGGVNTDAEAVAETVERRDSTLNETFGDPTNPLKADTRPRGCWASCGSCSQKFAPFVLLAATGVVIPFV